MEFDSMIMTFRSLAESSLVRDSSVMRTGMLQRAAINSSPVHEVLPNVHEVLRSPGQPLDAATRAFMEPRFGHDFSGVRIHTDAKAAESARAVNALAYTVGRNIVFDVGRYAPHMHDGQRLIAHELTHVVQQASVSPSLQANSLISGPGEPAEMEAARVASALEANSQMPPITSLGMGLQRDANTCTYGEIRAWAITSQSDFTPPAGLGDAKTSIGAVCARGNPCNCVDGSHATAPGDQHAWQNIVAANGVDQSGGGRLMCVGTEACSFVHQCTRCVNGHRTVVEREPNLTTSGTATVAGQGTLYFYIDPLQGWCNARDRRTACHATPTPRHGSPE